MLPKSLQQPEIVHASSYQNICVESSYSPKRLLPLTLELLQDLVGRGIKAHYNKRSYVGHSNTKIDGKEVLLVYEKNLHGGLKPDRSVLLAALKTCTTFRDLERGIRIHAHMIHIGDDTNVAVATTLVHMYAKCRSMVQARQVFDKMLHPDLVSWTVMILGYVEHGDSHLALQLFAQMQNEGFVPDAQTYVVALKACADYAAKEDSTQVEGKHIKVQSIEKVVSIHSQLGKSGLDSNIFVASTVMDAYAKCGSMEHAHWIFYKMTHHDLVSWNAMILGCIESGESDLALHLFNVMQDEGFTPNARSYVAALKACASCAAKEDAKQLVKIQSLEIGMAIHSQLAKSAYESDIFIASVMVDLYAKCRVMELARSIFDKMQHYDLVSWTAMILGYVESGDFGLALQLFARMQDEGFTPDLRIYVAALKACDGCAAKEDGKQVEEKLVKIKCLEKSIAIHSQIEKMGKEFDIFVANALVNLYAKCGSMDHVACIFDKMPHCTLVSWNAIISGYAESGRNALALQSFSQMQDEGFIPDARTYIVALKACGDCAAKEDGTPVQHKLVKVKSLEKSMTIHSQLRKSTCGADVCVASTMVDVYAKCGSMEHARQVFDKMPHPNLVAWNAILFGYVENGENILALKLFAEMHDDAFIPDDRTYVSALKACAGCVAQEDCKEGDKKLVYLEKSIAIHSQLAKVGYESDSFVASKLVDVYAKCGSIEHARRVFDKMPHHNSVLWNSIMFGYVEHEDNILALQMFVQMQDEGFLPDSRTYVIVLKACASCGTKEDGKQADGKLVKMQSLERCMSIHSQLAKSAYILDIFVASTMVDVYCKCGSMHHARWVFDNMPYRSLVLWNALLSGYVENEKNILALELFAQVQDEGFMPDVPTYIPVLKACSNLGALETGKRVHVQICSAGLQNEPVIAACLIGFYGKCGSMLDAEQVFDLMTSRNLVVWNAFLAGYAHLGDVRRVFGLFRMMQEEGLQANSITFLSVFHACSHTGLVDKGKQYFWVCCMHFMLSPGVEHYNCLVDLLGRASHIHDALEVVKNVPFVPGLGMWKSILGACRKWKDVVTGRLAFESVLGLHKEDASVYVLMANIYAVSGMQEIQT